MKKVIETRTRKKIVINEDKYIQHLLETYPTGILSMVSDTFNLWDICTKYMVKYKEEILARDGKLVIRPDSGDPVDILCGELFPGCSDMDIEAGLEKDLMEDHFKTPTGKGVIELLWDVFGGTINEQGYKVLDSHIGAIYGDSITIERANEICKRLEAKGFASTNIVLGVGSFTYQFNTRDTFGFAMKATYVEVKTKRVGRGLDDREIIEGREIFKDPITDDGVKKSAKGLLHVAKSNENGYMLVDQVTWDNEKNGELQTIYKDGEFYNQTTLTEIRERLKNS